MPSTTLNELECIHDCVLLSVLYDASSNTGQTIRLMMRCPIDLGHAPWEGKNLMLTAVGVAVSQHVVCGVAGTETIDAVRPDISAVVREGTVAARRMGVRFPELEFTISFHSGSSLEVICQELWVDVGS